MGEGSGHSTLQGSRSWSGVNKWLLVILTLAGLALLGTVWAETDGNVAAVVTAATVKTADNPKHGAIPAQTNSQVQTSTPSPASPAKSSIAPTSELGTSDTSAPMVTPDTTAFLPRCTVQAAQNGAHTVYVSVTSVVDGNLPIQITLFGHGGDLAVLDATLGQPDQATSAGDQVDAFWNGTIAPTSLPGPDTDWVAVDFVGQYLGGGHRCLTSLYVVS